MHQMPGIVGKDTQQGLGKGIKFYNYSVWLKLEVDKGHYISARRLGNQPNHKG